MKIVDYMGIGLKEQTMLEMWKKSFHGRSTVHGEILVKGKKGTYLNNHYYGKVLVEKIILHIMFYKYNHFFPETYEDCWKGIYYLFVLFILACIAYHDYISPSIAENMLSFIRCSKYP
ncbi:U24a [Human betaherpesvirus 7]|uniref:U24a protein n=3 Tax=Human betaherpesvirus 7 TaxID=10372 RepID=Q69506_HHV7J|nr:U24a [Human betaherpesvirus 7]